ncbi:gp53-like domain-containing protein [Achromobacter sp. NCFB-sbj8-Ac1-l]|uniref:gp53-like domain-containing protein n=1 Tax=unclassified Achromobacter TaxID=2626865 RepID=UPI004046F8AE
MQVSNAPSKSAVPFADSGTKNNIPVSSQIGITPGAASFTDGFPPLTMTPLAAGGVPPYGADFNGILNFLSTAVRWAQAGGRYPYDAAFATAAGGYPKGAVLAAASGNGSWLNLADNNTSNPDSGGANWVSLGAGIATTTQAQALVDDLALITPKKLADAFAGGAQSLAGNGYQKLPGGLILQWGFQASAASTTTSVTFPIAFPNTCLAVLGTGLSIGGNIQAYVTLNGLTQLGCSFNCFTAVGGSAPALASTVNAVNCRWLAIGY